jgi:hypothetical protein
MGHHLRSLVKFVQRGGKLETHSDIPEDVRTQLYAKEQQHLDRKRKRRDLDPSPAGHTPMIINNYIPVNSGQALSGGSKRSTLDVTNGSARRLCLSIPGLRDDAVEAYCEWHCSKVRRQDQKQHYRLACDLILERGFDLDLIHEENDAQFYIERGVLEDVARRFVRDVKDFLDQYDAL